MLLVKTKGEDRQVVASGDLEEMQEQFDKASSDNDFDTIEIIDRTGRLYRREHREKPAVKKAAKKKSAE